MDKVCEYFKLEEKEDQGKEIDRSSSHSFFQTFFSCNCSHENCKEQTVDCYGMKDLCKIDDIAGED